MIDTNTVKTEWDLSCLLTSGDNSEEEMKKKRYVEEGEKFVNKWKHRTDYLEKPSVLKKALDEYEKFSGNFAGGGEVGYYYVLKNFLNQNDPEIKAKYNKIQELVTKTENDLQFFTHRVAKIPEKDQDKFLSSPELREYKHFLERLFVEAKYLLSEDEEKILNLMSSTSYTNWVKMTSDFLTKREDKILNERGKKVTKSFTEIWSDVNDRNKMVRDSAAKAFNRILKDYSDTAEAEINSILQTKKVSDELRKMERPDLARHLSDDIDSAAIDSLISAVESRFDISKRYYKLKAQLNKVRKLKYHERNVEYGVFKKKFSFEESVELVGSALKKLDGEFYYLFRDMVENGRIDVYPRKGKESSEFCATLLKDKPTYILLNHSGKLNDVTTLAHEMGHAINDEMIKKHQNALNMFTPISTAEVASTFMQDFVLNELSEEVSDNERLTLDMMRLDDVVSAVMRQVACYKFELELHGIYREKGYVSKEEIGKLFQKHMKAYMGPFVEQSEGSENWWVHWSHIRSYFYVYSYASGLLISKFLQDSVKEDPRFIGKVKEFLSAGSSDSPRDIFSGLGINIDDKKFWLKGLGEIDDLLKETTKLAVKLGKV
jgi:oligoendopeptidase F